MGLFGKKQLSEQMAAHAFVDLILQVNEEKWPGTVEAVSKIAGICSIPKSVWDHPSAYLEFALAIMSIEMQALPNLMPPDQARRIRDEIIHYVYSKTLNIDLDPEAAIIEYDNAFELALQQNNPTFCEFGSVVVQRLVRPHLKNLGDARVDNVILHGFIFELVMCKRVTFWKTMTQKYKIVQ